MKARADQIKGIASGLDGAVSETDDRDLAKTIRGFASDLRGIADSIESEAGGPAQGPIESGQQVTGFPGVGDAKDQ